MTYEHGYHNMVTNLNLLVMQDAEVAMERYDNSEGKLTPLGEKLAYKNLDAAREIIQKELNDPQLFRTMDQANRYLTFQHTDWHATTMLEKDGLHAVIIDEHENPLADCGKIKGTGAPGQFPHALQTEVVLPPRQFQPPSQAEFISPPQQFQPALQAEFGSPLQQFHTPPQAEVVLPPHQFQSAPQAEVIAAAPTLPQPEVFHPENSIQAHLNIGLGRVKIEAGIGTNTLASTYRGLTRSELAHSQELGFDLSHASGINGARYNADAVQTIRKIEQQDHHRQQELQLANSLADREAQARGLRSAPEHVVDSYGQIEIIPLTQYGAARYLTPLPIVHPTILEQVTPVPATGLSIDIPIGGKHRRFP